MNKKNRGQRPSPAESATQFPINTRKKGQDGSFYVVTQTSNGVKRWKKDAAVKSKTTDFKTWDNGGHPFLVSVDKVAQVLKVFRRNIEAEADYDFDELEKIPYNKLITRRKFNKIFIPNPDPAFKAWKGNSILAEFASGKYLAVVGGEVFEFKPPETIFRYYSEVGNSGVPYPYGISKKFIYVLGERCCLKRSLFYEGIDWKNEVMDEFYSMQDKASDLPGFKTLFSIDY